MAKKNLLVDEKKKKDYAHLALDWDKVDWDILHYPFVDYKSEEQYQDILRAIRNVDNLYFTAKYILNLELAIFQLSSLQILFRYPFPMLIASRGLSKSWMLAVFLLTKSLLLQGHKSVIVGAAFRQSKIIFEYMETIWNNAPVLQDICGAGSGPKRATDMWTFKIGHSIVNALPLGNGDKIRGQRGNTTIVDEFQSVPEMIYEVVVGGFSSVSSSPAQNVKRYAQMKYLQDQGVDVNEEDNLVAGGIYRGNQSVIAGTGDWGFKHFAKYWKRYKGIIESQGDKEKLRQIFKGKLDPDFNWKDYAIIRIPIELAPPGFMEEKHVLRQQATVHSTIFNQEYGATFPEDSDNFYRMSIIQACVTDNPIELPSGRVQFRAALTGERGKKYIYGVDPASESDNFAIVILELNEDHTRVVFCWTTDRQRHMDMVKNHSTKETAFYSYAARKIRDLMRVFPCDYISLDSQGGGIGVMEALHDNNALNPGELPIWTIMHKLGKDDNPILFPGSKDWGHDDNAGLHMLEMVSMSNSAYVADANHEMRRHLENKILLFPFFDPILLAEAHEEDEKSGRERDTLEDCVMEIEELKRELTTIQHSTSQNGRDKWDTPEILESNNKKSHLRKDRYSALLMAHALARRVMGSPLPTYSNKPAGGFASQYANEKIEGQMYYGPDWFVRASNNGWGTVIRR